MALKNNPFSCSLKNWIIFSTISYDWSNIDVNIIFLKKFDINCIFYCIPFDSFYKEVQFGHFIWLA